MADRIAELMDLASSGDEDVILQVESEFALLPDTAATRLERAAAAADEMAESYAPRAEVLDADKIDELAEDAGF